VGGAEIFDARMARRDLARLRRRGPARSTRRLLEGIVAQGANGASVLDVGGGVGALQLGLLEAGAARVLSVEAAPAYQAAAADEARRRGLAERVAYRAGDVVELASEIGVHDVVTLDRVLCCYPDADALVDVTAARAGRLWGAVLPRERWWVRLGLAGTNVALRLRRVPFRVFAHDPDRVARRLRDAGFEPVLRERTAVWHVWLYERVGAGGVRE
jgi:magnesium-protoporphyrin O-methyltransferase